MTSNWILGRRWLAVMCNPRQEGLAAREALKSGWTIFYPCYRIAVTHANRRREVIRPYLPNYVFAEAQQFLSPFALGKTQGVSKVLRDGDGSYAEIPDTDVIMRALLKMADADGLITIQEAQKPITRYKAGDTIRVGHRNPFAGFEALVKKLDRKRRGAEVWLQIFGRLTPAFMPDEDIEVVTRPRRSSQAQA